ncbi:MAG: deoxyuridine 5-triphosphate nucleotidohydrolase, dUTP pyrophosphatase [Candidatus Taylorbacteria bacterium]|nr:deoxyuridine 5-triphosphate nucleotidohydrolase, dUTP pyrophosphatase [Candidatus Taylorbacteria bacterium]
MEFKIKKMRPDAKLPTYAHPGDVGMDLYSTETCILMPGERRVVFVGFAMEFPIGYAAIVKDKSSLPNKAGIHTMGGVYDAGYRGEYNVQLINLGQEPYEVAKGDKIAQLVILPVEIPTLVEVDALAESARGEGRFGSTGKQ